MKSIDPFEKRQPVTEPGLISQILNEFARKMNRLAIEGFDMARERSHDLVFHNAIPYRVTCKDDATVVEEIIQFIG